MKELKNIMILGAGAVGTVVAGKLLDAGYSPNILCDAERKARYSNDHFYINEKRYAFDYVTLDEVKSAPDFIIIATKHYDLKTAISGLGKIVDSHTLVMSLLNGIDSEAIIGETVGHEKVVPAFIVKTDATKIKNRLTYQSSGIIAYGEADKTKTERLSEIAKLFSAIGMDYKIEDDILKAQWWKYMVNIGMNQTSAVLGAEYGYFHDNAELQALSAMAMHEVVLVANANGVALSDEMIPAVFDIEKGLDKKAKTSMLQDVNAERKTEADMLAGQLIALAEKADIPVPVNRVLYLQLKVKEAMYKH